MKVLVLLCLTTIWDFVDAQEALDLSQDVIDAFLAAHNKARADDEVGAVTWNGDLAATAAAWVQNCQFGHSHGQYGENIFASWPKKDDAAAVATSSVESWVAEKQVYLRENKWSCAFRGTDTCGHYSQVVWANTKQIGCAIIHCSNLPNFVACEYNPPGNYVGQKPF